MPGKEDGRICGLRRKTFLIVLAVLLLLVAAAIGGAVGGVPGTRNKSVRHRSFPFSTLQTC